MEIELNTLLVALMFVTILSMGIGNILMGLADVFNHATASKRARVHSGWIVLLLLIHLNLFWYTKAILEVEGWAFGYFLLAIAGPMLLFFATNILLTEPKAEDHADLRGFFTGLGRRFFAMFALLQIWILAVSYTLSGSFGANDLGNVVFLVLAMVLMSNAGARLHVLGIWTAWLIGLGTLAVRWVE